ncbi:MAG: tRNA (adenosine(37)-N6)-dimethylallyltransferase MiaA [Bacteroidetes bacterium]|nr:tRNA (adenosine(37)-N6)-dimethylallyltransferase MiaA [Bacteroidota bacterium]
MNNFDIPQAAPSPPKGNRACELSAANLGGFLPIIIGPTASQKTRLAALVTHQLNGEIISADSRQVYRGMTIGTGKDLDDYIVRSVTIPYHLIDIRNAGEMYNVFEFQEDFLQAYNDITQRGKLPVLCGGTGMYVEAIVKNYAMHKVPEDAEFRKQCEEKSFEELVAELKSYKTLHNSTDIDSKKRLIRALEIARYEQNVASAPLSHRILQAPYTPIVIGIDVSRDVRRKRIEERFAKRLHEGMIDEVKTLMAQGVTEEQLLYYGLEYKYTTLLITGKITQQQFETELLTAIFQFAKRQMTWFRGMERRGIHIHWINGEAPMDERVRAVVEIIKKS